MSNETCETAMREAMEKVLEIANREWDARRETSAMWEIHDICTTALAKPQRNCDKFPYVDVAYDRFMSYVNRENPSFTKASPLHTVWDALKWVLGSEKKEVDE